MSSKTDQAVNAPQGEDRRSPTAVMILMPETDPGNPAPQTSKNVTADARKLLSVVAIELAFVFLVTSGFYFNKTEGICAFVESHRWISLIALVTWMVIQVIYMFRVYWPRGVGTVGSVGPLLGLENILIFVLTTLCLTVVCVFMTICSDGEMIIQAFGGTLGVLLLVIVVAVLTPLNTTGWGKPLCVMAIVLGLTDFFIYLAAVSLSPASTPAPATIELLGRIVLILGIIDVILCYFYILYHLQTIVGGKMDKDDGWFNTCFMLFWILYVFVILLRFCRLMQAFQVLQAKKSSKIPI